MQITAKLKFKSHIFKSSNKFFCIIFFLIYIKTFKNLSAKYYQENKGRPQNKKLVKDMKTFLKKKNKKATIWS